MDFDKLHKELYNTELRSSEVTDILVECVELLHEEEKVPYLVAMSLLAAAIDTVRVGENNERRDMFGDYLIKHGKQMKAVAKRRKWTIHTNEDESAA